MLMQLTRLLLQQTVLDSLLAAAAKKLHHRHDYDAEYTGGKRPVRHKSFGAVPSGE